MKLIRIQDTQELETPNGNFGTGLATSSKGAQELSVVRQRQIPGGFNPLHTHDAEEVMAMLEGKVTVSSEGQETSLEQGETLIIPAGLAHRVDNIGTEDAQWLIISKVGVRFFRENGDEALPGWAK